MERTVITSIEHHKTGISVHLLQIFQYDPGIGICDGVCFQQLRMIEIVEEMFF